MLLLLHNCAVIAVVIKKKKKKKSTKQNEFLFYISNISVDFYNSLHNRLADDDDDDEDHEMLSLIMKSFQTLLNFMRF